MPRLELRALTPADADAFFRLVQRNRAHLTQFGDYEELVLSSVSDIERGLADRSETGLNMGIWFADELIGTAALNPVKPGIYVLGYWISSEHTGKGYATESCRTLLDYAQKNSGAVEFWAGIRYANGPSIRVAEKLGFKVYERLAERSRWRLDYSENSP
jgi:RimJ/RimL family protein N-acetyltransferase